MTQKKKTGQEYQQLEFTFEDETGRGTKNKGYKQDSLQKQNTKPKKQTPLDKDRNEYRRLSKADLKAAEEVLQMTLDRRQDVFVGRIIRICRVSANQAEEVLRDLKAKGRISKTGWVSKK